MRATDTKKLAEAIRSAPIPNTDKRMLAYHLCEQLNVKDADEFVRRASDNYAG